MKSTTPMQTRVRRFITDRYAYTTDPNYAFELVAFGLVVATAFWSAQWPSAEVKPSRTERIL